MIDTFLSGPNWAPAPIEAKLAHFYQLLEDLGFKAHTIGKVRRRSSRRSKT
jgi:hypothetical protein